jgi:hypothetical protein
MTWIPIDLARRAFPPDRDTATKTTLQVPTALWIVGTAIRAVFIACLLLITVRVSMPQSATVWTAYDSPGDLIRLALGLAVGLWIAGQLFAVPKDAQAHRTWLYLGLAAVPFALICLIAVWQLA